jgi:hypothetical protein
MSMETRGRKRKLEELSADPRRKYVTSRELYDDIRENKDAIESGELVITDWDVSEVTDLSGLFEGFSKFNQPLNWDTRKVKRMIATFHGCRKFNQELKWETGNVTNLSHTFQLCVSFNQPLNWDTSKVKTMERMLFKCREFNQPLERWNTGKVRDMHGTFCHCSEFNQPLGHFDTSNVEYMSSMFVGGYKFNQPLAWDTSKVKDMSKMFRGCPEFNQPLKWDTRAVIDMYQMFYGCTALESVMEFDMGNVTERDDMFGGCGPGARVIDVGMAARRVALENLKLREEDEEWDDEADLCVLCSSRKARVLINHEGPVGEKGPHRSCGECIHEWITTKWGNGQKVICPFCRTEFKLSQLQKTAFGRYARKARGHKRRAAEYRNLHRVGLADAHDARAREYALGAARVLGVR